MRPRAGAIIALLVALELALPAVAPAAVFATTPAAPTVSSTSHTMGVWSADNTPDIVWSSGTVAIDGWGYEWDHTTTLQAPEQLMVGDVPGMTSEPIADGAWYFHLKYVDVAGNWSATAHLGPFYIDTTPPDAMSLSSDIDHPPGTTPSDNNMVGITWSPPLDGSEVVAGSGLAGFSWQWDVLGNSVVPDTGIDADEHTTGTTGDTLQDGTWYFFIRSVDKVGNWSSTTSIGPFVIAAGPTVQIDSGPANGSTDNPTSVSFSFYANVDATFECQLDAAPFATCTSPITLSGLSSGPHTFGVRGTDSSETVGHAKYRSFTVSSPPIPFPSWSGQSTTTAGEPYAPSVAYDPAGKMHVVYLIVNGSPKGLYYATNKSGTWQHTKIGSATGNEEWTSIAVDSLGKVHIAYQKFGVAIYYLTNASGAWTKKNIRSSPGFAVYPEIAVDSSRKVHIVYFVPSPTSSGLRYSTNSSGFWTTKRVTKSAFDVYADIALDTSRKVHIAYGRNGKGYRYLTNKSGTWKDTALLTTVKFVRSPSIDLDSHGVPFVALSVQGLDSTMPLGTWLAHKTSSGWIKAQLSEYPPLGVQVGVAPDGSEHLVTGGGGSHYSDETGTWQWSSTTASDGTGGHKVAFDVGPSGELVVVWPRTGFRLGVVTRPPAD